LNFAAEMPSILLKILKEAPQLSSLIIHSNSLEFILSDKELCKYLNKMIKKLDIDRYAYHQSKMSVEINPLYEIKEKRSHRWHE
jgi:hypothetical protein